MTSGLFPQLKKNESRSIRDIILRPYTRLIIGIFAVITLVSTIITINSSFRFVKRQELENSKLIINEIHQFLDSTFELNQHNLDLFKTDIIQKLSPGDTRTLFSSQYSRYKKFTLIGMGLENGTYIDVQYLNGSDLYSSERNPESGDVKGWRTDQSGQIISLKSSYAYDHRVRPWYIAAKNNKEKKASWTPIYITINPKSLFLTATQPIYSDLQEFLGVTVSSLSLTEIGNIIRSIHSLENRQIFILERDGNIVASTMHDIPFNESNGSLERLNAIDSQDEILSTVFKPKKLLEKNVELKWIGFKPYFVSVYPINDDRGVDWQMIIANPADVLLWEIGFRMLLILFLASFTIVFGIWIGRKIGFEISKPILEIKNAANQIVRGNLKERVHVHGDNEVSEMANSFNKMGDTIHGLINNLEDLVKERTVELEQEIEERKQVEEALKSEKVLIDDYINSMPGLFYVFDEERFVKWNQQFEIVTGYSKSELSKMYGTDFFDGSEKALIAKRMSEVFIEGVSGAEAKLVTKHGERIPYYFSGMRKEINGKSHLVGLAIDITNRKQAEDALRESEMKHRVLFESSRDAILVLDPEVGYIDCNDAAMEMFGFSSKEEFLNLNPITLSPEYQPDGSRSAEKAEQYIAKVLKDDFSFWEWTHIRADGAEFPATVLATKFEWGNRVFLQGTIRDITERKQATERIESLNDLKEKLLRTGGLEEKLDWVTKEVTTIFNADFCRIWISKQGDLCDRDCFHAGIERGKHACQQKDRCLHLIASSGRYTHLDGGHRRVPFDAYKIGRIASGREADFITNNVISDPRVHEHDWAKEIGLVSFAGYQLLSTTGDPIGVLALFSKQNISSEEHALLKSVANTTALVIQTATAEEELRENKDFLEKMIENIPDMIFLKDAEELRFVKLNKAGEDLLGYQRQDLISKNDYDFFPKEEADFFTRKDRDVLESGKLIDIPEEFIHTKNKGQRILHTKKIPLYNKEGVPSYLLGISEDITKKKQIEEDKEKLILELKEALENIKVLSGLVPICAKCKKIRDDKGYWNNLESFIEKHSDAQFSHGICQDCAEELYKDSEWYQKRKKEGKI